jgi:nitrite reductase/ring-hydroxylating ferredoxin subunit
MTGSTYTAMGDSYEEGTVTIGRRAFLKLAGSTMACACAGAVGISGCARSGATHTPAAPDGSHRRQGDQVIVTLSAAGELAAVGGAVRLALDGGAIRLIVVHSEDQVYHAFADRCTHNGKELDYAHEEGEIRCRSRKSRFDRAGNLIKGPAEGGLVAYPLYRQGDELVIEVNTNWIG